MTERPLGRDGVIWEVRRKLDEKIGTDTIIVVTRGIRGHDRAYHGLPKPLYPATRLM